MFEKYRKLWVFTIFSTLLCGGGALDVMSCLYLYLSPKLPSVEELKEIELQIPLRIYSQDLKVMAEFGEKKRNPVSFDQIPNAMVDAFLAAEDASFFEHGGSGGTAIAIDDDTLDPFGDGDKPKAFDPAQRPGGRSEPGHC